MTGNFGSSRQISPDTSRYDQLYSILSNVIPKERLIRDPLRTFAYGTDASFYRLIPKLVVRVRSEAEVIWTLKSCRERQIPFTFRAAGTSLSGQSISDSVLIQLSRQWNRIQVSTDGKTARFEPAVLGGEANGALAKFQRRLGPDPASIDAAMIGGIAANNSSGMCCGNVQDTYHTLASARIVFPDGSVLVSDSEESRMLFRSEHSDFVNQVHRLAIRVRQDTRLSETIRHKYRIKNTMGYSLNALIDFADPIDVITHLLIGSEGTLGFMSELTYNTVPDPSFRATSLMFFSNMHLACEASSRLSQTQVAAVELMDWQSIHAVEGKPGIPEYFSGFDNKAVALLVEVRAESDEGLHELSNQVNTILASCSPCSPVSFTTNKAESKQLWDIRKGLFPSLGSARQSESTIIIEDVAFPIAELSAAAVDLRDLLNRHTYSEAVIFGHALQGNLHFVFCVNFNSEDEVRRYASFLDDLATLVVTKYGGSLKAEHGTGRNMAPFVQREWGSAAFNVMREIKHIFDPDGLLNPGVIINDDSHAHISNLKATPRTHAIIEKCTECGFCERTCPSKDLTLTPRHRIAAWREISRLNASGEDPRRLKQFRKAFTYAGDRTCATDGLCATFCPAGIDTGAFIKELRASDHSHIAHVLADVAAGHLNLVLSSARLLLDVVNIMHLILGTTAMTRIATFLRKASGNRLPEWNPLSETAAPQRLCSTTPGAVDNVIYFPSCVSRLFGPSPNGSFPDSQNLRIQSLLSKAGFTALYPLNFENLCCGMAFQSKGYSKQADRKTSELVEALTQVSNYGEYPILIDTSPCAFRLESYLGNNRALELYDINKFLMERIAPRMRLKRMPVSVAVHVPCSVRKSAQQDQMVQLARLCAERVSVSESIPCCGFAGDRGFTNPELPASALINLKQSLPSDCQAGYSSSRTCEIGLSLHSGINYQSIAYLVDEAIKGAQNS